MDQTHGLACVLAYIPSARRILRESYRSCISCLREEDGVRVDTKMLRKDLSTAGVRKGLGCGSFRVIACLQDFNRWQMYG